MGESMLFLCSGLLVHFVLFRDIKQIPPPIFVISFSRCPRPSVPNFHCGSDTCSNILLCITFAEKETFYGFRTIVSSCKVTLMFERQSSGLCHLFLAMTSTKKKKKDP